MDMLHVLLQMAEGLHQLCRGVAAQFQRIDPATFLCLQGLPGNKRANGQCSPEQEHRCPKPFAWQHPCPADQDTELRGLRFSTHLFAKNNVPLVNEAAWMKMSVPKPYHSRLAIASFVPGSRTLRSGEQRSSEAERLGKL